jgi:hypothetical protein
MFRNDFSAVSLLGSCVAAGHRPSFRPAVEALEERLVLDSSAPSQDLTDQFKALTQQANVLTVLLANSVKHSLDSPTALRRVECLGHAFANAAVVLISQGVGLVENELSAANDTTDPAAVQESQVAFNNLLKEIFIAEHHHPAQSNSDLESVLPFGSVIGFGG